MKKSMKFLISKSMMFEIPHEYLFPIAFISFILTAGILWFIAILGMAKFLLLISPAYFANIVAFWSSKIRLLKPLDKPIDLKLTWIDGNRILGDSKTCRGILSGLMISTVIAYFLYYVSNAIISYSSLEEALFLGFLAGIGAMGGDLVRSFFKRRIGLRSGENWFPFDDLDFALGALLLLGVYVNFPMTFVILTLIGTLTLRFSSNIFDFTFKLKKSK